MIRVHAIPAAFSGAECDRLLAMAAVAPTRDAGLVGRKKNHTRRRASLVWIDDLEGADWVMDRIIALVSEANRAVFDFALDVFRESAQIARYDAGKGGHFDWHSDIGDGPLAARRKLTLVVQLSDPADYAGGALEIRPSGQVIAADRGQGAAVVFPSYLLHRVAPVTAGSRSSLTIWAHGRAFR